MAQRLRRPVEEAYAKEFNKKIAGKTVMETLEITLAECQRLQALLDAQRADPDAPECLPYGRMKNTAIRLCKVQVGKLERRAAHAAYLAEEAEQEAPWN